MLPVKYSRADYEAVLELFIWSNIVGTYGVVVSRWQRYLLPLFTFTCNMGRSSYKNQGEERNKRWDICD